MAVALHPRHQREEHATASRDADDGGGEHRAVVDDVADGHPGELRNQHAAADGAAAVHGPTP